MNKKNRAYLVILLLLLMVAGFFIWKEKKTPHIPPDQAFAVQDTSDIEKVIVTDSKGNKATLEKEGKYWKLNDTAIAMPVKINFMLSTLASLKMEYPVSDVDRIKADIMRKKVKVEVYNDKRSATPDKVIYVGEVINEGLGNYAIMEEDGKMAEKPYIIDITGFHGDIQARFFTKVKDWRDLKVFDAGMDDIKSVTILYPLHPLSSFQLTAAGRDSANIERVVNPGDIVPAEDRRIEDEWNKRNKSLNKVKVNDYLNSFGYINAEAYDNDYFGKDTILDKMPLAKIYLELKKNETDSITIYLMPANKKTKTEYGNGQDAPYDMDRYYAVIHGRNDFVVIQQFVFGKILRRYDDFFTLK